MLLHHLQDDYFTTKSFDELMPYARVQFWSATNAVIKRVQTPATCYSIISRMIV